jgi:hypothetical protein
MVRQDQERLMKRENAADLCIALGMNEIVSIETDAVRPMQLPPIVRLFPMCKRDRCTRCEPRVGVGVQMYAV